jgi:metal-responsive CopG/Arc/MetJ family transcriptional regulator
MARVTVTFSISLPPEMAKELDELCKKEHRTRSELLREALHRYSHQPLFTASETNVVS